MSTTQNGLFDSLRSSRLLTDEQLESLAASAGDDPARIVASLNQSRWITPWQLRVIESGASGPFQLGDYLLLDRLEQGAVAGCFVARHLPSNHPVLLQFVAGDDASAPRLWLMAEKAVARLAPVRDPGVLEVFAAVELPEFSFVATELPAGKSLAELLPAGKKTKPAQAAMILAQVARATAACHAAGIVHGQIGMDTVWLASKNLARLRLCPLPGTQSFPEALAPEQRTGSAATVSSDAWQLGCLYYRLVTGHFPADADPGGDGPGSNETSRLLAQEKIPAELQRLATGLLAADPAKRPDELEVAAKAWQAAAGENADPPELAPPESLVLLRKATARERVTGGGPLVIGQFAGLDGENPSLALRPESGGSGLVLKPGPGRLQRTTKNRNWWPWAGLAAMLGIVAAAIWMFQPESSQRVVDRNSSGESDSLATSGQPELAVVENGESPSETPGGDSVGEDTAQVATGDHEGAARQNVVPDDGMLLWASPTAGPGLDASGLPPAPRMVFSVRCLELANQQEFQRLLAQPGSGPASLARELESVSGLKLEEVAQLLVGVYPGTDPARYELFLVARLPKAVSRETLIPALGLESAADGSTAVSEGDTIEADEPKADRFQRAGRQVALLNRSGATANEVDTVCIGSSDLMEAAFDSGVNVVADGTFGKLAAISDNDRMISALVVPAALFNDAGQALTAGVWAPVFESLGALADDSLRAVMFSVELEGGCFLEAALDHSVDLRPDAALEKLRADLRGLRSSALAGLAERPGHPWWEKVRLQLAGMFHLLSRQTRTAVENDLVVANCWLPEVALHNLLGGGELALGGLRGAGVTDNAQTAGPAATGPRTIEELLRLPRSLEVTTNPDLGVLLQGIEDEVNNDHPELGFRFRIRLEGPDLLKQGITQNQRPGNFSITEKPLADMLTEIMFRANPNKAASGPNDPLCELVWVVAPDPEQSGLKMVQVTTRTASEEKMLELPPAFRLE